MIKGDAFLLRLGNGKKPPCYRTIAGLRLTALTINGEMFATTIKERDKWRELLSEAGSRSVSVSAAGFFFDSNAETVIRTNALAGTLDDYQLSFENGETIQGQFLVSCLDYVGDFNGGRRYMLQLESSGEVQP